MTHQPSVARVITHDFNDAQPLLSLHSPLFLQRCEGSWQLQPEDSQAKPDAVLPALSLAALGSRQFCQDMGIRYAYVGGSMAKGISSVSLVRELSKAGMLGFFGAAGLPLDAVEAAIDALQQDPSIIFGCNLIHSPAEPRLEEALVDLYIRRGMHLVEASAFLDMRLSLVRYRTHGIHVDHEGNIVTPHRIIAKVSREEVAEKFFSPPPASMLEQLVQQGHLTAEQAQWASHIPVAEDVTAEADSGGHTDNRPALTLFPTLYALKTRLQKQYGYAKPLRLGLGGGIGTPSAALAGLSMGADYLVVGTVHQACVESGSSDVVRKMLADTRQADVTMAPSGDMFEMGVTVQVIKRGTMFPMRAAKLYQLYRQYDSIAAIPVHERQKLESTIFKQSLDSVWQQTADWFRQRDPVQIERAQTDAKHQMALVFRWYLGQSPGWANTGDRQRIMDYQIWCGPAMGAFNEWAKDSFLAQPEQRRVACVALNLLYGAALQLRVQQCQLLGISLPETSFSPLSYDNIVELIS